MCCKVPINTGGRLRDQMNVVDEASNSSGLHCLRLLCHAEIGGNSDNCSCDWHHVDVRTSAQRILRRFTNFLKNASRNLVGMLNQFLHWNEKLIKCIELNGK